MYLKSLQHLINDDCLVAFIPIYSPARLKLDLFGFRTNKSIKDSVFSALHLVLKHLVNSNSYINSVVKFVDSTTVISLIINTMTIHIKWKAAILQSGQQRTTYCSKDIVIQYATQQQPVYPAVL